MILLKKLDGRLRNEDLKSMRFIEEAWKDIEKGRYKVRPKDTFFEELKKWVAGGGRRINSVIYTDKFERDVRRTKDDNSVKERISERLSHFRIFNNLLDLF